MSLCIIDTECANLASIQFAFERLGVSPLISDDHDTIKSSQRVILPGVGSAPYALQKIKQKNLFSLIQSLTQPIMGICLGMQLLYETLEEGGDQQIGFGLVPGHVKILDTLNLPSPHMGWNALNIIQKHPLIDNIKTGDHTYFVHSYAASPSDVTLASAQYGHHFSAIIAHKNIFGCQFHPERSSHIGAQILQNFLKITV